MSPYGLGKMGKLIASTGKLETARRRMTTGIPSTQAPLNSISPSIKNQEKECSDGLKFDSDTGPSVTISTRDKREEKYMHHLLRAEDINLVPAYVGNSKSFNRCSLVDGTSGSVHMGLGLCASNRVG